MSKSSKDAAKSHSSWLIKIFIITFILSIIFNFLSTEVVENLNIVISIIILILVILTGVISDMIATAVTAANEAPFHAKAADKKRGAKQSVAVIKNADKVSNVCGDVIGDICGVLSGAISAIVTIKITEKMPLEEIRDRLRAAFTDELYVTDVFTPRDKFTDIAYAAYRISGNLNITKDRIEELLSANINIVKKTKSGEKNVNIRPQIKSLTLGDDGALYAVLDASGASYLNPDILCRALFDSEADYHITRTGWFKSENGELKEFI